MKWSLPKMRVVGKTVGWTVVGVCVVAGLAYVLWPMLVGEKKETFVDEGDDEVMRFPVPPTEDRHEKGDAYHYEV